MVIDFGLVNKCLLSSWDEAQHGRIDFDDQLLLPAITQLLIPKWPLVMVDEAQDLSLLNHRLLEKLVGERLIAVGDPHQAIYEFRGADNASILRLTENFAGTIYRLTKSFRCSRAVVKAAQSVVPYMTWRDDAPEGQVTTLKEWTVKDIPDDAAVICRNNAPLYRLGITMLQARRPFEIRGRQDITQGLITAMKKLGPADMVSYAALEKVDKWELNQKVKYRNKAVIEDRAECMRALIGATDVLI